MDMTTLPNQPRLCRCPFDHQAECGPLALAVASGDDLRDQLEAALRIIADDNKIDVQQAQRLVTEMLGRVCP